MTSDDRPDPDRLLARVQTMTEKQPRGRLKIYLGYAAGVGKTYSMLEAARLRGRQGVELAVGYVECHGRPETEALLNGLEIIPRRELIHREITIPEMDLDAILARRPQLVLVDELAHTNAPGSRHLKRWQDVQEILSAGIDVFTTLNIQHLESLNDAVAQITGIVVRETVPDQLLDKAAEVELVDLPPPELMQRLREGKVYIPEQAGRALRQFFQEGHLIALRELALRRAANRAGEEMRSYLDLQSHPGYMSAQERILVCISGSPYSERLIRTARRLAENLKAEWYAVHIETSRHDWQGRENQEYIWRDMRLAESLGAKVSTTRGDPIAAAILEFARQKSITKILVGRPAGSGWKNRLQDSLVHQLIRESKPFDIVVTSLAPVRHQSLWTRVQSRARQPWLAYLAAAGLTASATLLCTIAHLFLDPVNLVMIYLLAVVITALRFGMRPAILSAFLGVLAFDFFFVPPRLTFAVEDYQYLLTFAGLFSVGIIISSLMDRVRQQTETVRNREAQTASLYALSRELASAADVSGMIQSLIRQVQENLALETAVLLPETQGLTIKAASPGLQLDENEVQVARWAFLNGRQAGWRTETLSFAKLLYLPMMSSGQAMGILAIKPSLPGEPLSREKTGLLEAFSNQMAMALERAALARQAEESRVYQKAEKLHRAILNSISHDLRTPLVTITGAISSLREEGEQIPAAVRQDLLDGAWEEAGRLNRFIANLLEMSRLEAGALRPRCVPSDTGELVRAAIAVITPRLEGRKLELILPENLPLVPLDFSLMTHVLLNLLDNGLKYTAPGGHLRVEAGIAGPELILSVTDNGPGISPDALPHIFEKFYRGDGASGIAGSGIGLAICQGIVEAHQGWIKAGNLPGGGSCFTIGLPLDQKNGGEEIGTHD